jgi:hypothetical protein
MEELLLEDSMRTQLHIHDPSGISTSPPAAQQRQNRPRKPKQPKTKAPEATIEESINSLKNEIEYMPMKTPISILQELLSRRGKKKLFDRVKILLIFVLIEQESLRIMSWSRSKGLSMNPLFAIECLSTTKTVSWL